MNLNIVRYCAEEVGRQQDHPDRVADMVEAWVWAQDRCESGAMLTSALVEGIGRLVTPKNRGGYREVQVYVGEHRPVKAELVPQAMEALVARLDLTPEEFYRVFQEIHPFTDGNGRTGKILYNWLKGTLDMPVMPPNFWGISNP